MGDRTNGTRGEAGRLYLVRHGEPLRELADERQLTGGLRELIPLSARGQQQAHAVAVRLREVGASRVVSSPVCRSLETAAIIASDLQIPLSVDYDLREWGPLNSLGWESAAAARADAKEFAQSAGEWPPHSARSWEPRSSLRQRAGQALDRLLADEPVVVCTHGRVIESLTGHMIDCGDFIELRWGARRRQHA